ncbi:GntR family transcriptional regulator [Streptomyces sp. INA 01156]
MSTKASARRKRERLHAASEFHDLWPTVSREARRVLGWRLPTTTVGPSTSGSRTPCARRSSRATTVPVIGFRGNDLMATYGVARMTARQALSVLRDEGVAEARKGAGDSSGPSADPPPKHRTTRPRPLGHRPIHLVGGHREPGT